MSHLSLTVKLALLTVLAVFAFSCASKTKPKTHENQALPVEEQKEIYLLLLQTALEEVQRQFDMKQVDCYVQWPKEVSFAESIIESAASPFPLRPASECKIKGMFKEVYGKKTHRYGVLVTLDTLSQIEGKIITSGYGWHDNSLAGRGFHVRFEKINGKWVVKENVCWLMA